MPEKHEPDGERHAGRRHDNDVRRGRGVARTLREAFGAVRVVKRARETKVFRCGLLVTMRGDFDKRATYLGRVSRLGVPFMYRSRSVDGKTLWGWEEVGTV